MESLQTTKHEAVQSPLNRTKNLGIMTTPSHNCHPHFCLHHSSFIKEYKITATVNYQLYLQLPKNELVTLSEPQFPGLKSQKQGKCFCPTFLMLILGIKESGRRKYFQV